MHPEIKTDKAAAISSSGTATEKLVNRINKTSPKALGNLSKPLVISFKQ